MFNLLEKNIYPKFTVYDLSNKNVIKLSNNVNIININNIKNNKNNKKNKNNEALNNISDNRSKLWDSIYKNDLLSIGHLLKKKIDITMKHDDGTNILWLCTMRQNTILLEYFLKINNDNSFVNCIPENSNKSLLYHMLRNDNYEEAEILIKYGGKIITDDESLLILIEHYRYIFYKNIKSKIIEITKILKLYFSKNITTTDDILWHDFIIQHRPDDILEIMIEKNKKIVNNVFIIKLFEYGHGEILEEYLDYMNKEQNIGIESFHFTKYVQLFANIGHIDEFKYLLNKNNIRTTILNKNIIDIIICTPLIYSYTFINKNENTVISMLEHAFSIIDKYNLQNKLTLEQGMIHAITQNYHSVITLLVNRNCHISDDHLSYAVYCGNLITVKHIISLINEKYYRNNIFIQTDDSNIQIGRSTTIALKHERLDIFEYLQTLNDFKISDDIFIYYCIKNCIVNVNIFKKYNIKINYNTSHTFLSQLLLTFKLYNINHADTNIYVEGLKYAIILIKFSLNIDNYCSDDEKYSYYEKHLKHILSLFNTLAKINASCMNITNSICHMLGIADHTLIKLLFEFLDTPLNINFNIEKISYIAYKLKSFVKMNILNYVYRNVINYNKKKIVIPIQNITIKQIRKILNFDGSNNLTKSNNSINLIKSNNDINYSYNNNDQNSSNDINDQNSSNDINDQNSSNDINDQNSSNDLNSSDDLNKFYSNDINDFNEFNVYKNNKKRINVHTLLYRLKYPVLQTHYDYFAKVLLQSQNIQINNIDGMYCIEYENIKYCIDCVTNDNKNKIKPTKWFKYYAKNICSEDKRDINHMFPFAFDFILSECPCIEINLLDKYNNTLTAKKIYFSGYIETDGVKILGEYEFFIDSQSKLFHRLFMPNYNNISKNTYR